MVRIVFNITRKPFYTHMKSTIYLDNAATTPLLPEVSAAMRPFLEQHFGNPSSIYSLGRTTKMHIEQARESISKELNCKRGEIIFTSSGTESINKVLFAAILDLNCKRIITSAIEHHATLHTIEHLQKTLGIEVQYVNLQTDGTIDENHLADLLKSSSLKTIVSLLHANNEIGTLTNMSNVSALCQTHKALLHMDTVQSIAHYKIDLTACPIDFLSCSGHKFHGPKGIGFVYVNGKNKISPLLLGGGQERNMRAGTENVAGIIGLEKAFLLAYQHLDENKAHIFKLKTYLHEQIQNRFSKTILFGNQNLNESLYTVLNIGFLKNPQTEMLPLSLDIEGICISSGSACSSGSENQSHVIAALKKYQDYQPIRFAFSILNTLAEIDQTIAVLDKLLN